MKKIILRLYKNGKRIRRYTSDKVNTKVYNIIKLKLFDKAYVKVLYGIQKNSLGKNEMFFNDGWRTDKKELIDLIKIFWSEN